jgi:hypothetical protein
VSMDHELDDVLREMHRDGLTFKDMEIMLKLRHGHVLSVHQLKRRAYKLGLYRRKGYSTTSEVVRHLQVG